jgi:UDP-glucose:(heptosyl)LPS alpha-1,3-glucosyltransferase
MTAMRIGLISRRFDPAGGGTERDLIITARILAAAGHRVTIFAAEVREPSREFDVRRLATPPLGRSAALWWFGRRASDVARREGAEVVLSFARILDADVIRSGGGLHASYVDSARRWRSAVGAAAMRLSPYHRVQIAIERRGFNSIRLKRAIAVSNFVRDDLAAKLALNHAQLATIYNGVELSRFKPASDPAVRDAIRREFGIPEQACAVAFVGNGFARKGLRFLIEAWPALDGNAWLVVAGVDRAARAYQKLAARCGVAKRIRFAGAQPDVARILSAMNALALPSLFEPFGNVVLEAMASGLPVLASTSCGAAEVIPAAMREFIVRNPEDVGELASRMSALIAAAPDCSAIARAAAEQFTWERYGVELLGLLDQL